MVGLPQGTNEICVLCTSTLVGLIGSGVFTVEISSLGTGRLAVVDHSAGVISQPCLSIRSPLICHTTPIGQPVAHSYSQYIS